MWRRGNNHNRSFRVWTFSFVSFPTFARLMNPSSEIGVDSDCGGGGAGRVAARVVLRCRLRAGVGELADAFAGLTGCRAGAAVGWLPMRCSTFSTQIWRSPGPSAAYGRDCRGGRLLSHAMSVANDRIKLSSPPMTALSLYPRPRSCKSTRLSRSSCPAE